MAGKYIVYIGFSVFYVLVPLPNASVPKMD